MTWLVAINLDRSPDRWASFERANSAHVAYERFSACDGTKLARSRLERDGVMTHDLDYTPGAIGNALSHITLWRRALAEARPLTICEDDAIFNKGFRVWSQKVLGQLAGDFDIIIWGWNFDAVIQYEILPGVTTAAVAFDQAALRSALDRYQGLDYAPSFYRLGSSFGLPCYTISPRGAAALLKSCLPLRPAKTVFPGYTEPLPNLAIDVAMSAQYPSLKALISLPPLVVTPNLHESSTVQTTKGAPG
jgi:GR25 family glycosyltransferase involved in LPS biosynthesis